MDYYFSADRGGFISAAFKDDGTYTAQTWPADAVPCTDNEVETYRGQQAPDGKVLGSKKGRPAWIDTPKPTNEELIMLAESRKQALMVDATAAIAPLQDAVDLDMATPEEEALLKEWKKYRVLLNRVDTSSGAAVVWPTPPALPAR